MKLNRTQCSTGKWTCDQVLQPSIVCTQAQSSINIYKYDLWPSYCSCWNYSPTYFQFSVHVRLTICFSSPFCANQILFPWQPKYDLPQTADSFLHTWQLCPTLIVLNWGYVLTKFFLSDWHLFLPMFQWNTSTSHKFPGKKNQIKTGHYS